MDDLQKQGVRKTKKGLAKVDLKSRINPNKNKCGFAFERSLRNGYKRASINFKTDLYNHKKNDELTVRNILSTLKQNGYQMSRVNDTFLKKVWKNDGMTCSSEFSYSLNSLDELRSFRFFTSCGTY